MFEMCVPVLLYSAGRAHFRLRLFDRWAGLRMVSLRYSDFRNLHSSLRAQLPDDVYDRLPQVPLPSGGWGRNLAPEYLERKAAALQVRVSERVGAVVVGEGRLCRAHPRAPRCSSCSAAGRRGPHTKADGAAWLRPWNALKQGPITTSVSLPPSQMFCSPAGVHARVGGRRRSAAVPRDTAVLGPCGHGMM